MACSKKKFTICLYIVFNYFYANSQIINAETSKLFTHNFVTSLVQVFKSESPVPIDAIITQHQNDFQRIKKTEVVFSGFDNDYYWFRFVIENQKDSSNDLVLLLGPSGMKEAALFQGRSGTYTSVGKTGTSYRFASRPYQYAHFAFPIRLPAKTVDTFYLSMTFGNEYRSYAFALMDARNQKKNENTFYMIYGIIVGHLLLFLILNIYLFFSIKEKIHLWYSLYIGVLILIVLINDGLSDQFLGIDSGLAYKQTTVAALSAISIVILIRVIELFLTNIKSPSLLSGFTLVIKINLVLSVLTHFVISNFHPGVFVDEKIFNWINYSIALGIIIIFFKCAVSYSKGFKAALPMFLGLAVFFTGCFEKLLAISRPSYIFPPSLFHVGIVMETTIISFVLFYRHRNERKENLQYIREKEKRKVDYEKEILEKKLELQEKIFKNISQEVHDNIGQLLSLAKLNLNNITPQGDNINIKVSETELLLNKAVEDLGHLSKNIQHESVVKTGLVEAIKTEIELIKKTGPYDVRLHIAGKPVNINNDKEAILYRIVQEVLNNIIKHADATEIHIDIDYNNAGFLMRIIDNGKGFALNEIKQNIRKYGLGLRNIESRAKSIGATLEISSNTLEGTIVSLGLQQV